MLIIRNEVDGTISKIILFMPNVKFDIELRGYITIIDGYSSSGKTFLINSVKEYYINNKNLLKQNYGVENILVLNYSDVGKDNLYTLKKLKNSLIFIDNADTLLSQDKKLLNYISWDSRNQYVIMSNSDVPFPVSPNHYCQLVSKNNIITTNYYCNVRGWM